MNATPADSLRGPRALLVLGALLLAAAFALSFLWVSPKAQMTLTQRIFYTKLPLTFVAYFWFLVTLVASALYLKTRAPVFDRHAASAAGLGVMCAAVPIICGALWAKMEWGRYWDWADARLVSTLVLASVYVGYHLLRWSIEEPARRARFSAVLGVLAFVMVPIVNQAIKIWQAGQPLSHPDLGGGFFSDRDVQITLFGVALPGALLFTFGLHLMFVDVERLLDRLHERRAG